MTKKYWLLLIAVLALSLAACQTQPDNLPATSEPIFNGTPMSQVTLPPPSQAAPDIVVRDQAMVSQRAALIAADLSEAESVQAEPTEDTPTTPPPPAPTPDPEPIQTFAQPPTVADFALPEGAVGQLGIGSVDVVSLSPSGEFLVVNVNEKAYMYQAGTLTRMWRAQRVGRVTWLADGQRVGIGSSIYDAITGTVVAALPLEASAVAWSPDGTLAATHDIYGTVVIWDVLTGARLWNQPPSEDIARHPGIDTGWTVNMVFSPDNQRIAISSSWQAGCVGSSDDSVHVYYARGGGHVGDFTAAGDYHWDMAGSWSPTGRYLVAHPGSDDYGSGMSVWDIETGALVTELREASALVWLPDTTRFAVLQGDVLEVWDASTATRLTDRALAMAAPTDLTLSRDGSRVAIGSYHDPSVTVMDITTGEINAQWEQAGGLVGFGTDNSTVIGGLGMQNSLAVWHTDAPDLPTATLQGMSGINSLAWSPDGTQVLSTVGGHYGHRDGYINWDVASRSANFSVSGTAYTDWVDGDNELLHVDWSPDGRLAVISILGGDEESQISVIDTVDQTLVFRIDRITPMQAEFSPDGSLLAVRDTKQRIQIYRVADGELISGKWGDRTLMDMAWSPDGTQIAAASVEADDVWYNNEPTGKVTVWDAATGDVLYTLEGLTGPALSVMWSPDGARIAVSTNTDVAIFNAGAASTEPVLWLYSLIERGEYSSLGFTEIAWSPDGSMIAGAYGMPPTRWYCNGCGFGERGMVMVWDAFTAERLYRFEGHADEVQTVAFSPDGSLLASGSLDGTILLWDMSR